MRSAPPPSFQPIARAVAATRRRLWLRAALLSLCGVLGLSAGLALAAVWLGSLGGGPWLRWALGLALVAVAVGGLVRWFALPAWGWRSDDAVAERLEQGLPILADGLRASVQFARVWPTVPGSPALVARLADTVAAQLARSDLRAVVPFTSLRRPLQALVVVAAAWGLVGLLAPETLRRGLAALQPPVGAGEAETGPLVGDLELVLTFPEYVGRAPQVIPNSAGEIEAPKGTRVSLRAVSLEPVREASLRFGEGDSVQALAVAEGGRALSGAFTVTQAGVWRFAVRSVAGAVQVESAPRPIRLEADRPPQVVLQVPAEDVTLQDLQDVPVAFEAQDDFGLKQVRVVIALAADLEHPAYVELPGVQGRRFVGDEVVDLSVVQAQAGDRIALFVEAFDNNGVDGPQRGVSATRYITVNSPKEKHFELTERLRAVVELLLTGLADRLEVALYDPGEPPLAERVAGYRRSTQAGLQALGAVVADMVDDPLTPAEVRLALAGRLGTLETHQAAEGALAEDAGALAAGQRGFVDRLNKANEQVVDGLEQAIVLVEAMVARLALQDMEALAEELQGMRARLKELIQQYKENPDDAALKARIMRDIQRLRERMQAMQARMAQLRQKLPEEFLNLDGLKQGEVSKGLEKTRDQLAELEKLLEQGDIDEALSALEAMEQALDELSATLDQDLQKLHEESDPALQKALSELMDQTKDLMREQAAVGEQTEALEREAQARMERMLEEALKGPLEEVARKAEALERAAQGVDPRNLPRSAQDDVQFAQQQAGNLRRALERKQLMEALEASEQARQHLRDVGQMSRHDPRAQPEQTRLGQGERLAGEVSEALREALAQLQQGQGQGQGQGPGGRQQAQALGQAQRKLAQRAGQLQERIGQQAQQAPQLGEEAQRRIAQAGEAMEQAGQQLGQGRPGGARPGQQQAMSELEGVMQALKQANRPQRGGQQEGSQAGRGRRSSREKVKIPGAEDYAAPEAFRKDLLDAMKDEAPPAYQEQVKRYYESLVE